MVEDMGTGRHPALGNSTSTTHMSTSDISTLRATMTALQRTEPGSDACKAAQRAYAAANPAKRDTHKTVLLIGRAFSGDNASSRNEAVVTNSQTVRVYDSVSHTMTTCHSLTPAMEQAIREAADYSTVNLNLNLNA